MSSWVELDNLLAQPTPWYQKIWWRTVGRLTRAWQFPRQAVWQGLKSLVFWLPVIWKDRHWDHTFIFIMLRHKLKAMRALWIRNKRHVGWEKDVRRMSVCIFLLDRLIEENYFQMKDINGKEGGMNSVLIHKSDVEYLYHVMGKYVLTWWD